MSLLLTLPILLFLFIHLTYTPLASPLSHIPGPFYTKFTSLLLKYHELRATRTKYIHSLHLRYGPVVRVAPNEVSFASREAVKEIYCSGGSGYDKSAWYDLFKVYGRRTMFTTLNKDDHAKRKRILADRYANSNVMREPSLNGIVERAERVVQRCVESLGGSLDLYICLHSYAYDCVTHHLFHPYGADSLRNKQDEEIMREVTFDDSLQNRQLSYYSPTLHKAISKFLYIWGVKPRETPLADKFVLDTAAKTDAAPFTLLNRLQTVLSTQSTDNNKSNEDDNESSKLAKIDQLDIAAELLDHMVAGIDTTGDALCFLMWELSQPRSFRCQTKLRQELLSFPGEDLSFDKLPYLDAVVMEGLRCFPAIPMSLPRIIPRDGRTINGYYLPEGTTVSCQAHSVHRIDREAWGPDPDAFRPERWLEKEGKKDKENGGAVEARKKVFFAFANGGRGCVGKHLALAEMKILLREVYSRFTTLPDQTMTEKDMEMADQLISSRPAGLKCLLRFEPIGGQEEVVV
ncbi:cytochrome P450 [Sordaria brevicollis]|uniref:Cytochrome P450 n=1 Tax=Sordaria brevicollis TaxID=83679 RepID=A0AAE0U684_SORBR|nr:cytochrome P450 [Sordaria brevicollis]